MSQYILSPSLERAVGIALLLHKPLLLCGEPGTGKTTLAKHLVSEYHNDPPAGMAPFYEQPLIFNTKTVSTATDLFYAYDALARLRDAYVKSAETTPTEHYIRLRALGKAIAMRHGAAAAALDPIRKLEDISGRNAIPSQPMSSVVLIDEIDKAPRDLPNDILNEIDRFEFEIRELGASVPVAENNARILVIMTSNNEKNLPDAFLRRCVYHYIDFPGKEELQKIIGAHFKDWKEDTSEVVTLFQELRKLRTNKSPATAEFINWLQYLKNSNLVSQVTQRNLTSLQADMLTSSLNILFKSNADLNLAKDFMNNR